MNMIEIEDLTINKAGRTILSLDSLRIPVHGLHLLLGPNGAGKSKFLQALLGLEDYQGQISIEGEKS